MNHKRVYRLYRDGGLSLRLKKPHRNVSTASASRVNASTTVNAFTREALAIDFDQGIKGEQRAR